MRAHHVNEDSALYEYLHKAFPHISKARLTALLSSQAILVNGQISTRHDQLLKRGDSISIHRRASEPNASLKPRLNFPIVYEDDSVIVIDKPDGLLSMATDHIKIHTAYHKVTNYVKASDASRKKRIFIVHRLDRDVSGLLVFAKTEKVKEFLQTNWKRFEKKYYAIVEGRPKKPEGTIESYLTEDKFRRVYSTRKSPKSKLSITHYKTLEIWGNYSFLEVSLETGRKNQIRVHMADMGHPIAGDDKYGAKTNPIHRLGLHAFHLSFKYSASGKLMTFTSALPPNFYQLRTTSRVRKQSPSP